MREAQFALNSGAFGQFLPQRRKEPGVMNRNGGLIRKHLHNRRVLVAVRADFKTVCGQHADHFAANHERRADPAAHRRRFRPRAPIRVILHVRKQARLLSAKDLRRRIIRGERDPVADCLFRNARAFGDHQLAAVAQQNARAVVSHDALKLG